ncbi:hypothetical protein B7R21_06330 [Subtercola boreus]|uniref:Uncharacterized protein n=1 Tax=Subtercola boreus TaxID=120213 RepID=A0A3E0VYJ6_9MICO|nr:hypothetical protein [Subtercola boreus]RFA14559.1 hypothetical protein B7R21_06330 [Subtercola boreus]
MPDGIEFDFADLTRLAVQFSNVQNEIPSGAKRAATGSAFAVKKAWGKNLEESAVPASASTIEYTVTADDQSVEAVIETVNGTDRLRGYAWAREYGSLTVPPALDGQRALAATTADFERGMGIAGERALRRALNS